MREELIEISCIECDKDFKTEELKSAGDQFKCTHCGHIHEADDDWDENGNSFWFATNARSIKEIK